MHRVICSDNDGVGLKVWVKSSCGSYQREGYFFNHLIACFRVLEDSAGEIYGLLGVVFLLDEGGAECARRCCYVYDEGKAEVWFSENWGGGANLEESIWLREGEVSYVPNGLDPGLRVYPWVEVVTC